MMISVCAIVRNEQRHAAGFMSSVDGICDEVIVVDTGSTDDSVAVFSELGADVSSISAESEFDFGGARNEAIRRASGDWLLFLDADERLVGAPSDVRHALARVDGQERPIGFTLFRYNIYPNGHFYSDRILRLFKKRDGVRFSLGIGESVWGSIVSNGGVIVNDGAPCAINHLGPSAPSASLDRKLRDYGRRMSERMSLGDDSPFSAAALAMLLQRTGRTADAVAMSAIAVSSNPEWSIPWYARGQVLRAAGDRHAAKEAVAAAVQHNPDDVRLSNLSAVLAGEVGEAEEAIAGFAEIANQRPQFCSAIVNAWRIAESRGDAASAQSYLAAIQGCNPALVEQREINDCEWRVCDGRISDVVMMAGGEELVP